MATRIIVKVEYANFDGAPTGCVVLPVHPGHGEPEHATFLGLMQDTEDGLGVVAIIHRDGALFLEPIHPSRIVIADLCDAPAADDTPEPET